MVHQVPVVPLIPVVPLVTVVPIVPVAPMVFVRVWQPFFYLHYHHLVGTPAEGPAYTVVQEGASCASCSYYIAQHRASP